MWKRFKPKTSEISLVRGEIIICPPQIAGDFLSICVLPKYRATESKQIDVRLPKYVKIVGRKVCFLAVLAENSRSIHFCEKHGFVPIRALGDIAITYAKRL